jgi:hypothetical protein
LPRFEVGDRSSTEITHLPRERIDNGKRARKGTSKAVKTARPPLLFMLVIK